MRLALTICLPLSLVSCGKALKTEVCVYGGTYAAVTAARAAAEAGCKVVIICPDPMLAGRGPVQDVDVRLIQEVVGFPAL